jgi:hypothetical protein
MLSVSIRDGYVARGMLETLPVTAIDTSSAAVNSLIPSSCRDNKCLIASADFAQQAGMIDQVLRYDVNNAVAEIDLVDPVVLVHLDDAQHVRAPLCALNEPAAREWWRGR